MHWRRERGVDPPSIALSLDLAARMAEGDVVIFTDDSHQLRRFFDLHRIGGAFRICAPRDEPGGCFASPDTAIRAGWAMIDAEIARDLEISESLQTTRGRG